ncbi:cysteine hydrolase family protein [Bacillus suaedae]|uniref:Cysteine hydrolase n=1 Tax=Halalkalibacter suaedae TaxID=2822140 RepID=A0A941AMH0_9BACI|nr:isochorismatase family cysteine hydrolase [Bacillus suaedae]MBP3949871.1 cysteine hydrolase [Bacillus suaedae]
MPLSDSRYALLVIDMINDFEFSTGKELYPFALEAGKQISILKEKLKAKNIPIIYVNDNYGKWQSDFRHLVSHCVEQPVLGQPIAKMMCPNKEDYFILKPQFSGFFATPLDLLLTHLKVDTLILTGVTGNMCVLFTANDAYMREYKLIIPSDCIASETVDINDQSLQTMKKVLKADIRPSTELFK